MNCPCHGEPAYWQKDKRCRAGGWWECRAKRAAHNATRATNETRRAGILQRRRERYDADWRFRLGHNLKSAARKRRRNLDARKARLTEED